MHSWTLEGSWARVAFSIVLSGKHPWAITVSLVITHFFPSWYYTVQNSLSTSIRALGLSKFACYFKLPSRFLPISVFSGLVNFLCLVYSSVSGAWWWHQCKVHKVVSTSSLHRAGHEMMSTWWIGDRGDVCPVQDQSLERPAVSSTFILL